jgi:5'-nucleotidase
VDVSQSFGSRFSNIEVKPKGSDTWEPIDEAATYVVVANSFMAGGGDGYAVLSDVVDDGRSVDTFLDYAQSFIDYIVEDAGGVIGKPTEFSTQTYSPAP